MNKSSLDSNCSLNSLEIIREWLLASLTCAGVAQDLAERLNLALNELLANVIIHANDSDSGKKLNISLSVNEAEVSLVVSHSGKSFRPMGQKVPDIKTLPEGGMGLFIIESIFDQVDYFSDPDGNERIKLIKKI